ncbi:hypothetical protein D3C87_1488190 [compost metagenome]
MRYHFTHRLVISNDTRRRRINPIADGLAIDLDLIAKLDALSDMGRLIVNRDAPLQDKLLHLQARPESRLGKHLVKFGCFDLRQQNTFGRHQFCSRVVFVKSP